MIRQPLPVETPEVSSEQYDEIATIANDMTTNFSAILDFPDATLDDMILESYLVSTFEVPITQKLTFQIIPETFKPNAVNWALVATNSHTYFDYDLEWTFRIIKHERGRGRYRFYWFPGLDSDIIKINEPTMYSNRVQKYEWDIEQQSVYTIKFEGAKMTTIRTNHKDYITTTDISDLTGENFYSSVPPFRHSLFGTLFMEQVFGYEAGNVGPDHATIIITSRIVNPRFCEYHSPLGSAHYCYPLVNHV